MGIKKIKVLFVCTVPTERSGIPNVISNLIDSQDETTIKYGYVAINEPNETFIDKLAKANTSLYIIPRKLSNPIGYIYSLAKIAKEYDIMHVHGNSATMVLEMIAAKIAKNKVRIAHSHNTTCKMKFIDILARPLFYHLCNGRLACGKEAGEWLFKKKKFSIINNGINSEKFKFDREKRELIRQKLGIGKEIVIGHVGNFVEQKNHDFLIDVFLKLRDLNNNAKLLLVGDGPLLHTISKRVKGLDLDKSVIFTGSIDNVGEYMNAMDMVIMPSLFEGLPLTLIEEQANGLPILAADTITKDANIASLIKYMPLTESASNWAKRAIEIITEQTHKEKSSEKAIRMIQKTQYDIKSVTKVLSLYYENKINE